MSPKQPKVIWCWHVCRSAIIRYPIIDLPWSGTLLLPSSAFLFSLLFPLFSLQLSWCQWNPVFFLHARLWKWKTWLSQIACTLKSSLITLKVMDTNMLKLIIFTRKDQLLSSFLQTQQELQRCLMKTTALKQCLASMGAAWWREPSLHRSKKNSFEW